MVVAGVPLGAQERAVEMVEWRYVGADQAASKHSPLADINASNVDRLEIAWEWQPGERPNAEYGTRPGPFQAMPLMIENVLFVTTMYNRVVALDAANGRPVRSFGENGRVLLTDAFPNPVTHAVFDQTSPPVVRGRSHSAIRRLASGATAPLSAPPLNADHVVAP